MRPVDADKMLDDITAAKERSGMGAIVAGTLRRYVMRQPTLTSPNKWVSVEERLPENYTDVLCWYEYFRYGDYNRMYQTYGIGYCINGQWGGEVSNGTKCKVLYWQPLPTPPNRRPPERQEGGDADHA